MQTSRQLRSRQLLGIAAVLLWTVTACAGDRSGTAPALRPLGSEAGSGDRDTDTSDPIDSSVGSSIDSAPAAADPPAPVDPGPGPGRAESLREELDALLARFDDAVTGLYADPLSAGDDHERASLRWLDVVVGGSQLDREVRGRILAAARDDNMMVVPAPEEDTSFVNTASAVTSHADGSISWTNCGFSSGVGVDLLDRHVLDDDRAVTTGRGRAIRSGSGRLMVSELWDDRTIVVEPDAPNPCLEPSGDGGATDTTSTEDRP